MKLHTSSVAPIHHLHLRPHHRRFIFFVCVAALVCIVALTIATAVRSRAESIAVSAQVQAPPLSEPAIITSIQDQQHTTTSPVTLSGTCPEGSYIKLYRNGLLSGITQCDSATFSIKVSLLPGANILEVRVYNITDNEGPRSANLTLFYDAPVRTFSTFSLPTSPTPTPPLNDTQPSPQTTPFTATTQYVYQTQNAQNGVLKWDITLNGGALPYKIDIDWNDKTTSTFNSTNNTFSITHTYSEPNIYHPILKATDQLGDVTTLQLLAVVEPPTRPHKNTTVDDSNMYKWLIILGSLTVLLMVLLWINEHHANVCAREHRR